MMQNLNQPIGSHLILLKKLTYASWHRGTREMDLILGRFAENFLPSFSIDMLNVYQEMLDYSDAEIFDWIKELQSSPPNFSSFISEIRRFYKL